MVKLCSNPLFFLHLVSFKLLLLPADPSGKLARSGIAQALVLLSLLLRELRKLLQLGVARR